MRVSILPGSLPSPTTIFSVLPTCTVKSVLKDGSTGMVHHIRFPRHFPIRRFGEDFRINGLEAYHIDGHTPGFTLYVFEDVSLPLRLRLS
jgi:hypothetical protein